MKKTWLSVFSGLASSLSAVVFAVSADASELVTFSLPSRCIDPAKVVMADPPPGKPDRPPDLRVNVLLPEGYDGERRFPVLYLLHGLGGAYDSWLDDSDGELMNAVKDLSAIVVMPEAGVVASYANSFSGGTREPCWERYYLDELIPEMESRFRILPGRRWHAIGGFSSGGLGAMLYGSRKPGYFGQLLSFSGTISMQRPEFESGVLPLGVMAMFAPNQFARTGLTPWEDAFGDPDAQEFYWAGHNPPKLAPALSHTRIYVAHGGPTAPTCVDPFRLQYHCAGPEVVGGVIEANVNRDWAGEFMTAAHAAGAEVTYHPQTGGHWYVYSARFLDDAIKNWGLFEPVDENPQNWTYKTVSQTGDMWGLRFAFAEPPDVVETLARDGQYLRGEGSGSVTIDTPSGESFTETLPFVRQFPQ
jgi:S-formylglutathione hydrolase FrmB